MQTLNLLAIAAVFLHSFCTASPTPSPNPILKRTKGGKIFNSPSAAALASSSLIEEVYCKTAGERFQVFKKSSGNELPEPSVVIANGGGGQAGMIEFLAKHYLMHLGDDFSSLCIGWWASNTDGSHKAIQDGTADLAVVYDQARIKDAFKAGEITNSPEHIWMDRFALVGPSHPPIIKSTESVEEAAMNIMQTPDAFFLTRVDKSTAHTRESALFAKVVSQKRSFFGLDPLPDGELLDLMAYQGWQSMSSDLKSQSGVVYSIEQIQKFEAQLRRDAMTPNFKLYQTKVRPDFYRPIFRLPKEATKFANEVNWYTLSDHGIFNSLSIFEKFNLDILLDGKEQISRQDSFFLNPAYVIKSTKAPANQFSDSFLNYLKREDVKQLLVPSFRGRLFSGTIDESELGDLFARQSLFESPHELYQHAIESKMLQRAVSPYDRGVLSFIIRSSGKPKNMARGRVSPANVPALSEIGKMANIAERFI